MRCPKCHYISFERGERCRNCGYEFSLAGESAEPDLPLRRADASGASDEPIGPMIDLALDDLAAALATDEPSRLAPREGFDLHRLSRTPAVNADAARARQDLPLFTDRPATASPPRAPLAVRRSTPEGSHPRSRPAAAPAPPRLALEPEDRVEHRPDAIFDRRAASASSDPTAVASPAPAPAGRRLAAAAIDAALLAGIDLVVLYFTLRLCGLGVGELRLIPPVPFIGFLLLLNGGYSVAFTAAAGQTLGKMAAGIKVVGAPGSDAEARDRIGFGFAVLRTTAYLASALPAGLGFLPALIGRDRRALHDRLAETCVIRVSAIG